MWKAGCVLVVGTSARTQPAFHIWILHQVISDHYAVCHNTFIHLPSFSAFHDIGHHLSMFISESLMMAFWNAETCSSILSTNTLNEWCSCWSFTHHKKMYGPNCKKTSPIRRW
jgi:hypothetical protein